MRRWGGGGGGGGSCACKLVGTFSWKQKTDNILDDVLDTVFSKVIKILLILISVRLDYVSGTQSCTSRLGRLGVCIVIPDVLIILIYKHPPKCTFLNRMSISDKKLNSRQSFKNA